MAAVMDYIDGKCNSRDSKSISDHLCVALGASSGLGADQLKYLICLLAAIPLGLVFHALPYRKNLRMAFGMVWGLIFCFFCLGPWAWIHSFSTATITYLLIRFGPERYMHNLVFIFLMAYMSASHIYRMYTDYLGWHLDFTGPQMLLTQSLTALAFQIHDGRRLARGQTLEEPYLVDKALRDLPSLWELLSFVYFFPAFLAGPSHQFADFRAVCDGSLFPHKKCPPSTFPSLLALARALLFAPAFYLVTLFPLPRVMLPSFSSMPWLHQLAYTTVGFAVFRMRYYFGWYLSEAAFVASGAGWSANNQWDRVRNVKPLNVEFASNVRMVTSNWNICTANWLKYYVYYRLPSGAIRTYGTYFVSAFWHGFYPGYYSFFIYAALLTETARRARRTLRPLFIVEGSKPETGTSFKPLYDVCGIILTSLLTNFGGIGFVLLSWERTWIALKNQYLYGYIFVPVAFLYLTQIHPRIFRQKKVETKKN